MARRSGRHLLRTASQTAMLAKAIRNRMANPLVPDPYARIRDPISHPGGRPDSALDAAPIWAKAKRWAEARRSVLVRVKVRPMVMRREQLTAMALGWPRAMATIS